MSDDSFQVHGTYPVWQIERVTNALDAAKIDYQIEFDDPYKDRVPSPTGEFGEALKAKIYVALDQTEAANFVLKDFNERN